MTPTRNAVGVGLVVATALLGGLLLTTVAPSDGTFAALDDRADVTGTVGAGSMSLTVAASPTATPMGGVVLTRDTVANLTVSTAGTLPWVLSAEVLDVDGASLGCTDDGRVLPVEPTPTDHPLFQLCGGDQQVSAGSTPVADLGVELGWEYGEVATPWAGTLRLTLRQENGGFSDQVDVRLELESPTQEAAQAEVEAEPPATASAGRAPATPPGGPAPTPSAGNLSPGVTPAAPLPGSGAGPVDEVPAIEPEPAASSPDSDPVPEPVTNDPDAGP